MKVTIRPSQLSGVIEAPPSKSCAHRLLIGAALAAVCQKNQIVDSNSGMSTAPEPDSNAAMSNDSASELNIVADSNSGKSFSAEPGIIHGISSSEDMLATLDCIRALGCSAEQEGTTVTVRPIISAKECTDAAKECTDAATGSAGTTAGSDSMNGQQTGDLPVFPCRESGSTLRFFIPIALAVCKGGVFTGTERLISRGIGIYEELFAASGISLEKTETTITVRGTLRAGNYAIRGDISSQFVTGLLFALSLLPEDSQLEVLPPVESRAYIDITVDVMRQLGVSVEEPQTNCFRVRGGQRYMPGSYTVEGDWSNAAFPYGFQTLGHDLEVTGLRPDSIQGDKACLPFFEELKRKKDSWIQKKPIDISDTPDLGPVLFAVAAALDGGAFTGIRRLRIKESDRAAAMKEELSKFGISCSVTENEMVVGKGDLRRPVMPLNGHNDHRIVMALSLLLAITGGSIEGAEAVRKSWPDYFEIMKNAGLLIDEER